MPRLLVVAAVVLTVLSLLVWMITRPPADASSTERVVVESDSEDETPERDLAAPDARETETRVAEIAAPAPVEPVPADAAPEEEDATEGFDRWAKTPMKLRVLDPDGGPVADATVRIGGLRSESDQGSWFGYPGEEPTAKTNANGEVELQRLVWVNQDGRVRAVDLTVEHPEFIPFRESSFPLDREVVELERGATVVVTGWIGDPASTVLDVEARVDRRSRLGEDAWTRLPDGRLSTSRLTPGLHLITITHEHPKLGRMVSAPHRFTLGEVGWETVHIELLPPMQLVCELDPRVPRPIEDGLARVVLRTGGVRGQPLLKDTIDVEIDSQGAFVVEGVRPGEALIVAICRGWTSDREPPTTLEEAGVGLEDDASPEEIEEAIASAPLRRYTYPSIELPQQDVPFVVPMVETGTLEVTVLGPDGSPVEGAAVWAYPNYFIRGVGSAIVPGREWVRGTDENGVARLEDLPPSDDLWWDVVANDMQMSEEDRKTTPSTRITAGETATGSIQLEAGG